jgi:hypothetical protein
VTTSGSRRPEQAVNDGDRRATRRAPKNGHFVAQDDDFEFLELFRPGVQHDEFENPAQQPVAH